MYENPDWLGGYPVGRLIDDIASTQGYPGIEYFWRGDYWIRFAGWQGSGGTTPYWEILRFYGWRHTGW
jgi:hypothetical protein